MEIQSEADEPPLESTILIWLLFMLNAQTSSTGMWLLAGIVVFCILLSALMSGSEVAYFSLNYKQRKSLEESKNSREHVVHHLLNDPQYLLATILIANNLFNIAIILSLHLLLEQLVSPYVSDAVMFLISGVLITFVLVLFGEILPKVYANQSNVKFAIFTSRLLSFFKALFYPLSTILVRSSSFIENRASKYQQFHIDELDKAIDMVTDKDTGIQEKNILKGVVNFGNITASQVMRARVDVISIDIEESFEKLKETILEHGYSRIPVYKESIDEIKGVIYAKDLLQYTNGNAPKDWTKLIKSTFFVPESRKIDDLLRDFQKKRLHMAIVVDEYGGTSGIITLEDVLEEVVGEIDDEYDNESEMLLEHNDNGEYVFEGKIPLIDFCKTLKINNNEFEEVKGDVDSLAGLMLELEGRFLTELETVNYNGYSFTVLSTDGNRIDKVKVKVNAH